MKEFIINLQLSDYGSYSSIIGLIISFATLLIVFVIKKQFLFRSRIEEHTDKLGEIASDISLLLQSYDGNELVIDEKFAIANVKLRNIQKTASSSFLLSDVKNARRKIRFFRWRLRTNITLFKPKEKYARQIYTDINIVVEELLNVKIELLVGK